MSKVSKSYLTKTDYGKAVEVQTACNLSAVVHEFSDVLKTLWKEAYASGKGTKWVNTHPISRLYAEQIMFLATRNDKEVPYGDAYYICKQMAVVTTRYDISCKEEVEDGEETAG